MGASTELLTVEQVAQILGLHPKTVRRLIHEGRLPAGRAGRQWRISRAEVERFTGSPVISRPTAGRTDASASSVERRPGTADSAEPRATAGPRAAMVRRGTTANGPSVTVTAVVNVDSIDREEALRLSNTILAVLMSDDPERGQTRFDHIYYPEEERARFIFWGQPAFVGKMLSMLSRITETGED
ncbi:helix-turn-helix domain-containing protein [Salinispira pacifica]